MINYVLIEEFHVTVLIRRGLRPAEYAAARRTLDRTTFQAALRRAVRTMFVSRHKRAAAWVLVLAGVPSALFHVPMEDRVGGPFRLRAIGRAELRAPLAGSGTHGPVVSRPGF